MCEDNYTIQFVNMVETLRHIGLKKLKKPQNTIWKYEEKKLMERSVLS